MRVKSKPKYEFQEKVNARAAKLRRVGLIVFYGGGKSYMALQWLDNLIAKGEQMLPCVIVCPNSLVDNWKHQIEQHSDFTYSAVSGILAERRERLKAGKEITIISYSALSSNLIRDIIPLRTQYKTVICDESTFIKNAMTLRFKCCYELFSQVPHRMILTGRPITEKVEEIWAQMLFLDHGKRLGESYHRFIHTYFSPDPYRAFKMQIPLANVKIISDKVSDICISVPREQVQAELPPRETIPVYLPMAPNTRKHYKRLFDTFQLELDDALVVDTQWAIVRMAKLHQLCQGFLYQSNDPIDGPGRKVHKVDTTKLDWLKENIELILDSGPTILWAYHKQSVKMIRGVLKKLKVKHSAYLGGDDLSPIDEFTSGKVDCVVLSIPAASSGLNLQRAKNAVFFSQVYSASMQDNALARNYRSGSEVHDKIIVYFLMIEDSVDTLIEKAHREKLQLSDTFLEHLKGHTRE